MDQIAGHPALSCRAPSDHRAALVAISGSPFLCRLQAMIRRTHCRRSTLSAASLSRSTRTTCRLWAECSSRPAYSPSWGDNVPLRFRRSAVRSRIGTGVVAGRDRQYGPSPAPLTLIHDHAAISPMPCERNAWDREYIADVGLQSLRHTAFVPNEHRIPSSERPPRPSSWRKITLHFSPHCRS